MARDFFREGDIIGKKIRVAKYGGQRVIDFVSSAGGKLTERHQLFGLHQLRLQALQTFDGLLGACQQVGTLAIRQMLAEKNQKAEGNCSEAGWPSAEFTNAAES